MKKITALFLLLIFILAGCKQTDSNGDTSSQNNTNNSSSSTTNSISVNSQPSDNSQQSSSTQKENSSTTSKPNSSKKENTSKKQNVSSKENSSSESSAATETNDFGIKIVKKYSYNVTYDATFSYETFYDTQSGRTMPYRLYVPKNIKKNKKYPVILFLHGGGEIGSNNNHNIRNFNQGFSVAGDLLKDTIIICPQSSEGWSIDDYTNIDQNGNIKNDRNGDLSIAKRIVDSAVKKYNGDYDRIYVTGLSLGSFGTWDLIEAYPNYFAASVPVCGDAGDYASQAFIDTPIWIFHGTNDQTVAYEGSLATYQAIINKGGKNVKFTTLEGVDHNAWDYAYKDRAMFSWLLAQNRKNRKMVDNYKGILEIVSEDGTTVIDEKTIVNFWSSSIGYEEYIELYFNDEADSLLKQKYKKNKNQTFSLVFFGKPIYDFKFTEYPKDKNIKIVKTLNDEDYKEFVTAIENTIRFNKEINGF